MLALEPHCPYYSRMRFFFIMVLVALTLWVGAFGLFLATMYGGAAEPGKPSDALIVLTGGNARVERGLELLAEGDAPVLFISGVGEKVTLMEMLTAHAPRAVREKILRDGSEIVFDYAAASTQMNASQAAAFVRKRGYHSIRLITGHYHMPRSMVEFHAALPGVIILREPVVPDKLARAPWWRTPDGRVLIWHEFHKYLAAYVRVMLQRP